MVRISKVKKIKSILTALSLILFFGIGCMMLQPANAADVRVALVPGGPHPFFAPWEQAAADAKKDFNLAADDYKVPQEWKLDLACIPQRLRAQQMDR